MNKPANSHALLIYDTCFSANTAFNCTSRSARGVTELISACGIHDTTFTGPRTFTDALIKTLRRDPAPMFVSELHHQILEQFTLNPGKEGGPTPVHTVLTSEKSGRQIKLGHIISESSPRSTTKMVISPKVGKEAGKVMERNYEETKEWLLNAPAHIMNIDLSAPRY
jgi:hypothetical protein